MSSFKVSVSDKNSLIVLIAQALNSKLYVNKTYQLFSLMRDILINCLNDSYAVSEQFTWTEDKVKKSRPRYICSVAFNDNNEPIGCLFIFGYHYHTYIKPEYRNLGIASELLTETAIKYDITTQLLNYGTNKVSLKLKKKFNIGERIRDLSERNNLPSPVV